MNRFFISCLLVGLLLLGMSFSGNSRVSGQLQTQGQLFVIKHVVNNSGNTGNVPLASDFTITVTGNNPSPSTFRGSEVGTMVTLNPGSYSVSENQLFGNNRLSSNLSPGCSGSIQANQQITCVITNNFTGVATPESALISPGSPGNVGNLSAGLPSFLAHTESSPLTITTTDPPFQACKTPVVAVGAAVAPSSATYAIEGTTQLGKLISALKGNSQFTLQLFSKVDPSSQLMLAVANPTFKADFVAGQQPFEVTKVGLKINKIDTTCHFIGVVEPINQQNPNLAISPISPSTASGNVEQSKGPVRPAAPDNLLVGGAKLTQFVNTASLNPLLSPCAASVSQVGVANSQGTFAQYLIRGTAPDLLNLRQTSGTQDVAFRISTDLIVDAQDLARIVNNSNSLVKIQMIINPNTPNTKVIDVGVKQISTNCIGFAFSNSLFPTSN